MAWRNWTWRWAAPIITAAVTLASLEAVRGAVGAYAAWALGAVALLVAGAAIAIKWRKR